MTISPYKTKGGRRWRYELTFQLKRYGGAGYGTKAEALSAQEVKRLELRAGYSTAYSSFGALVASFLLSSASTKTADWTYQLTKKLEKGFGHLALIPPQQITPGHVEVALQDLERAGNGPRSVNEYRKIMHAVMQFALDREAIRRNPVNVIPKRPEPAEQVDPIPTADLKALILGAEPQLQAFLTVLSQTGARFREIALLPWSEVFTDRAEPFVILTTRKQRGGREKKTPQPLTSTAVRSIEAQRGKHDRWVFPSPRGTALVYNTAQRALADLCKRLELPHYGYHQIRHWTGLVAGQIGKNNKAVAQWLRHDSTQSTERYRHALAPEMWEIARALEKELDTTPEPIWLAKGLMP